MTSATGTTPTQRHPTVEGYLGPPARRFFGAGYKRATQTLTGLELGIAADGRGFARARAAVGYPDDWSRKGRANQRAHLSTIDVLVIGAEVCEAYLTHMLRLDPLGRSRIKLVRARIKAGVAPVEDELRDFAVEATFVTDAVGTATAADCRVGALRIWCEIVHPEGARELRPGRFDDVDALLGPAAERPYGGLHKGKTQYLSELEVDGDALGARAVVRVAYPAPAPPARGLDAVYHESTSILDAFVSALQLGQILLYELDGLDRAESNTMWMRQTTLEIGDADPVAGPERLDVRLEDTELLTMSDGRRWRTADIVARLARLEMRCSIAHHLPSEEQES